MTWIELHRYSTFLLTVILLTLFRAYTHPVISSALSACKYNALPAWFITESIKLIHVKVLKNWMITYVYSNYQKFQFGLLHKSLNMYFLRAWILHVTKGRSRTSALGMLPPVWKLTRIYFHCSQHTVLQYAIFPLLSLQNHRTYVKGHQIILRPQEFVSAGTAPPVLKFLDPPLVTVKPV